MLARTASFTSASGSCRRAVANSPSTDGRTRSTIARRLYKPRTVSCRGELDAADL